MFGYIDPEGLLLDVSGKWLKALGKVSRQTAHLLSSEGHVGAPVIYRIEGDKEHSCDESKYPTGCRVWTRTSVS